MVNIARIGLPVARTVERGEASGEVGSLITTSCPGSAHKLQAGRVASKFHEWHINSRTSGLGLTFTAIYDARWWSRTLSAPPP